jgi:hypothetical protein
LLKGAFEAQRFVDGPRELLGQRLDLTPAQASSTSRMNACPAGVSPTATRRSTSASLRS